MKITIIVGAAAIIATQIGCTWWLSKQRPQIDPMQSLYLEAAMESARRADCNSGWLRNALWDHMAQWPVIPDLKEPAGTLCANWLGQQN